MGSQDSINNPKWIIIRFPQLDRQGSKILNNHTFCTLPVVSAQWGIGTEKDPDAGIILNYDDDHYSQVYGQLKEVFRPWTKSDILQPYFYLIKILDLQTLRLMILVINYTFSI